MGKFGGGVDGFFFNAAGVEEPFEIPFDGGLHEAHGLGAGEAGFDGGILRLAVNQPIEDGEGYDLIEITFCHNLLSANAQGLTGIETTKFCEKRFGGGAFAVVADLAAVKE